jgi:hypothetical protein
VSFGLGPLNPSARSQLLYISERPRPFMSRSGRTLAMGLTTACALIPVACGASGSQPVRAHVVKSVPELAIADLGRLIDLPLPRARPTEALPSVDELVASDRSA